MTNRMRTTSPNDRRRGTRQSTDARHQKVYDVSREATVWAVTQYLAKGMSVSMLLLWAETMIRLPHSTWEII